MGMLFVFSSRPTTPKLPDAISYYHVHVIAYAGLGLLTARALARGLRCVTPAAFWGAVVIAFLYGVSDEYHQTFVPGRVFDVMDIAADGIGSVVGAGAAAAWGIIARRRQSDVL